MTNSSRLEHAVITGANRGIGAAIAHALAPTGAKISLLGRNREALEKVAAELGTETSVAVTDVTDGASVQAAFAQAKAKFGPVTILVNNAGQARSAPLHVGDESLWNEMLAVNLGSVYRCIRCVLPDMLQAGRGRIINIASTAGLTGYPYVTAYCAAKHGVIGLTRALAIELARKNITVNAVCPGYTDTDLSRDAIAAIQAKTGRSEADVRAVFTAHNPQGRMVTSEEVAQTVLWLCTNEVASITGQSIAVAGGELM
ncbi:MAG TPA: SDR family NAD(P)-dependent oxidoreductase [Steroidobacteraceae bacterium]|jgi:NAD(P)-dependent dehydrogenase (short-subunit alcohol dehydrogenase family)|nr:SDR family NAD(P)-dependent oxidoreductase [Steroidobacteraceae bacterium]HJY38872.1 SDR family NAD(P)-dependent oxidoreductase [Steroidobacteraceae bacterium]HJY40232.1 SDR family NAD(P)-dependent oxidoreductase [Steroidobacteraceae bacterium]